MTHRDLPGQVIEVPETAVPFHRASGWDIEAPAEQAPPPEKTSRPRPDTSTTTTTSGKE